MNILAISTHPDDETLGCGGTLLKHRAAGDTLYWMVVTQPDTPDWPTDIVERAAAQVARVGAGYAMEHIFRLGLPTTRLDNRPQIELINAIRVGLAAARPEIVYLIHAGDVHTDHRAVFSAALSVLKAFYMRQLGVRRVLSYETLSSTEAAAPQAASAFVPNVYSDIGPFLERKLELMSLFETETQSELYPRGASAIRALARFRGATIGVEYAEAFMLIREVM
jgi:LmbE family N-acetylglucosaminyl deacetylase